MSRIGAFFHWLNTPFRAVAGWFPFSRAGLATLIYFAFVLAGPALTLLTIWAMYALQKAGQWRIFAQLADRNSWALMVVVVSLGMFVSIRSFRLGPFEASGFQNDGDQGDPTPATTVVATQTVVAPMPPAAPAPPCEDQPPAS